MKSRRVTAFVVAAAMAFSSLVTPTFARYTEPDSEYVYIQSDDLVATVDEGNGCIVLTWPACDTEGNLIKANPLRAEGQINSNGNPVAGWTNPTNGMIILYSGWAPEGTNKTQHSVSTDHQVIKGIVDEKTDYPVKVYDGQDATKFVKDAYIDTTVVANSIATTYKIEFSKDGETWTPDHNVETFDHGRKLTHVVDGAEKTDSGNTFFLEDQITENITKSLESNTKYYIRVTASDSANTTKAFKTYTTEITTPAKTELTPAFPTVEGGGKYSQGGRGSATRQGDVYIVTNLTDSVSDPQPGSLRYGLERRDRADGNKLYPRTIVFEVGGTINVDPAASKSERRFNINGNTTIAGQTAPGDGITIAGASTKFDGNNIIVRYVKFRLGSGYDLDCASASGKNIVIDHCTFAYGVDETFSGKELVNSSIQYNIIDSGLSVPDKDGVNNKDEEIGADSAKHGMGSIFNGSETSFTHNLWANNGTRNPRFEGGFSLNNVRYENKLDFANNVVYNWGHGSAYGGARGDGLVNFENNYFKPGPNTLAKVKNQFYECYPESSYSYKSSYYVNGNVMDGNAEVTADNTKGFSKLGSVGIKLDSRVALENPYTLESAEDAYNKVLAEAGASLHRDAYDSRLINQVKNNTGYFVNSEAEAGGFDPYEYAWGDYSDADRDGIPDEVEESYGLDKSDASDSTKIITDESSPYNGYTYLERYINTLSGDWDGTKAVSETPYAKITSLKDSSGNTIDTSVNADLMLGEEYTLTCDVKEGSLVSVYLNDRKLAEEKSTEIKFVPDKAGSANLMILAQDDAPVSSSVKVFSDRINTTVIDGSTPLLGDVDCDGEVSVEDAALTFQYVLNKSAVNISAQGLANAQVFEGEIDSSFAAAIFQKVLVSTYKFETESAGGTNVLQGFKSADVGTVRAAGADFYNASNNTLVTEGNGFIGRTGSNGGGDPEGFHYNYKELTGDVTITAKIYNWSKIDYYQFSGLMVRGGLTGTDEFYAAGMTYLKDEDFDAAPGVNGKKFEGRNIVAASRLDKGDISSVFNLTNIATAGTAYLGVPQARADKDPIGGWAKIVKEGQKVTCYASLDGETWYQIYTRAATTLPETYYVGFATGSAQDQMDLITYNKSYITDIDVQYSAVYPS